MAATQRSHPNSFGLDIRPLAGRIRALIDDFRPTGAVA
jgi:hypothetical protein